MSALGRQRPLSTLPPRRPLSGAKRTSKTLEILDSYFRFRPQADVLSRFPVFSVYSVQVDAMSKNPFCLAIISHFEYPRLPGFIIICQANKRVATVVFEFSHSLIQVIRR